MATIEHKCLACGWATFNRNAGEPAECPKCGSKLTHFSDANRFYDSYEYEYR